MLDFSNILSLIKKSFTPRKIIDFEEQGLHFEMEPLTSVEEIKIIEVLKDIEGAPYIEGLKRYSLAYSIKRITITQENGEIVDFDLSVEIIEFIDPSGQTKSQSKFIYMVDFLGRWPSTVIDILFEAFTNMIQESEMRISKSVKFDRFVISEKLPEDKKEIFKPIIEEEHVENLDENERLQRKVEKELEQETVRMNQVSEKEELKMRR